MNMKCIKKGKEPLTLKAYRETTENATYKGFVDKGQLLKETLLSEQGHLCAYCMRRISTKRNAQNGYKPRIEVEHFYAQEAEPTMTLIYDNMLGVCNGNLFDAEHCDKSKKKFLLKKLNPLKKEIEAIISYDLDGIVSSLKEDAEIDFDLNILLNLNNQNLKDARKNVINIAKDLMIEKYPIKRWTKALIQKEIDLWEAKDKNGKFRPFCQIAIWFWEQQKKRNRYPAK